MLSVSFCTSHSLALWWGDGLQRWLELFPWRLLMISSEMASSVYVYITPQLVSLYPAVPYLHTAVPLLPQPQYVQNWIHYILPGSKWFSLLASFPFLMTLGYTWPWGSKVLTSLTIYTVLSYIMKLAFIQLLLLLPGRWWSFLCKLLPLFHSPKIIPRWRSAHSIEAQGLPCHLFSPLCFLLFLLMH